MIPQFPLCVIPAGGDATRMGDLCKDTPKCLLEVNGKPILQHILDYWRQYCRQFVVVTKPQWAPLILQRFEADETLVDIGCEVIDAETSSVPESILAGLRHTWVPDQFAVVLGDVLLDGAFDWSLLDRERHGIGVMEGDPDFARSYAVGITPAPTRIFPGDPHVAQVAGVIEKPATGVGVYLFNWTAIATLEAVGNRSITDVVQTLVAEDCWLPVVPLPFTGRMLNVTFESDMARW